MKDFIIVSYRSCISENDHTRILLLRFIVYEMALPSAFWQAKSITRNSMNRILVTGLVNECWFILDLVLDILKEKWNTYL